MSQINKLKIFNDPIYGFITIPNELIYDLIQQCKENNVSWKYTSILVDEGEKEYLTSTIDGDGNDINIFMRKKYVIKSY